MKKMEKKTKHILTILALLLVALVGGTIAYYTGRQDFKNEFSVAEPGVAIQEKFNPTDFWVPGEEKSKEVWFTNTGEMDMLLRFTVDAEWEGDHPKDVAADSVITLFWNQGNDQRDNEKPPVDFVAVTQKEGDVQKTYYYYTKILKAGESTQHVLESVKFSSDLSNDGHLNSDYSNTQINLTITGETVLADPDAVAEQWTDTPQAQAAIAADGTVTWTWESNESETVGLR